MLSWLSSITLLETIGLLTVASITIHLLANLIKAFYPLGDLTARYGPGSWVVITGASDGIGKGFARVFAKKGFSICLIARNAAKLNRVREEVQKESPQVQIKYIEADFKDSLKPGFFDQIYKGLEDLDVSILVNNVGVASSNFFEQTPENVLIEAMTINMVPQVLLTRRLINKLLNRGKYKSAIVNLSSVLGTAPVPYETLYSSCKAFNDYFSRSLSGEYHGKLDVLSLRPFYVSTPLNHGKKPGLDTLTAEECAEGCLRALGLSNSTFGHVKHAVQGFLVGLFPSWVFSQVARVVGPAMIRARRKKDMEYKRE